MLKKLIVWGMVLVMILSVAGCSPEEEASTSSSDTETADIANGGESKDKIKIGWAMSKFDDKWLSYMMNAAQTAGEELGDGVEVIFVDAKDDSATQLAQIEEFVNQGVDAIAIVPVDTEGSAPITDLAKEAGIPLVSVNREMATQADAAGYVGSDSIVSGRLGMEYLGELMGGTGKIVVMRGGDGHPAARDRTIGVKEIIEEQYPDIEIIAEDTAKWDRAMGQTLMENWINQGLEFDGVAANNDEMAIGALLALEEAGMADDVFVVGVDGTPDALAYVEDGLLSATVFQNAMGQGAGSIESAYTLATGGTIDKNVFVPYELVTADNLQDYIDMWAEAGWVMDSLN